MSEVGAEACGGFLVGGTAVCPLVGRAGSCLFGGQVHVKSMFIGGCEFSMSLGTLSADGWD